MGEFYLPDLRVFIGFNLESLEYFPGSAATLLDEYDPLWEVSDYVMNVATRRGRPSELDSFSPGSATIKLNNDDGRFDPTNATGPYYGFLLPNLPVWILADDGGATPTVQEMVFAGFVDGWPVKFLDGGSVSDVTIRCTDAMKIISKIKLPNSEYEYQVLRDTPHAYWRLDEAQGEKATDIGEAKAHGTYVVAEQGAEKVPPYGSGASLKVTGRTTDTAVQDPYVGMVVTNENAKIGDDNSEWAVELWFQGDDDAAPYHQRQDLVHQGSGGSYSWGWRIQLRPASYNLLVSDTSPFYGNVHLIMVDLLDINTPTSYGFVAPTNVFSGPQHLVVNVSCTGGVVDFVNVYLNATPLPQITGTLTPVAAPDADIYIGTGAYDLENTSFRGRIDDVAFYIFTTLAESQINEHYLAGIAPLDNNVTGRASDPDTLDEIGRFYLAMSRTAAGAMTTNLDNGTVTLGPAVWAGQSLMSYLQLITDTEQGRFFINKVGRPTFHQRDRFITETTENTNQFTFGPGGDLEVWDNVSFTNDDRFVFDTATVTREGGSPQTATTGSGLSSREYSGLLFKSDNQSLSLAEYIIFRYEGSYLNIRSDKWTVEPETNSSKWASVLGLEIGYRVTLQNIAGHSLVMHVESIEHSITPDRWTISFTGSPVDTASYLILDTTNPDEMLESGVLL